MTPLQLKHHEEQRAYHERRASDRRRAALDSALLASPCDRRTVERRAEIARRREDRIDAARFNFQLMRWFDARERNAA